MSNTDYSMKLAYRPDIDGLRAIAVLAVLFFHAEISGFSGGFVGVDIFFVISGFLITSILLKDIQEGHFTIAGFYERRIRRIFPALFPVISVILAVGAFLFDANAIKAFGRSVMATTLFSSNILFWRETGYFSAPSLQMPLLHTWSLAVEEQFYILFPLALAFINRYLRRQYLPWILTAAILSLILSIYGTSRFPVGTFYLVPSRAWELMVGSLLALGVLPYPSSSLLRNLLSSAGIGLILYSICFYTKMTLFPGYNAAAPVLGAALIIYSGNGGFPTLVARVLRAKPLVFVGLISYSLYLWHWPFVTFTKYMLFRPFNVYDRVIIILASLVVSTLSWKYIEQPFRGKQPVIPDRRRLFAIASVVMIIAVGVGGLIQCMKCMDGRLDLFSPGLTATLAKVQKDPMWDRYRRWEMADFIKKRLIPARVGDERAKPTFALWGDSHARALIHSIDDEALKSGMSGYVITNPAQPPVIGMNKISVDENHIRTYHDLDRQNTEIIRFLKAHPEIKTIILSARWTENVLGNSYKQEAPFTVKFERAGHDSKQKIPNDVLMKEGLTKTVLTLLGMKRNLVLVSMVPEIGHDVVRYYLLKTRFPDLYGDITPTREEYDHRNQKVMAMLSELARLPNVTLVSPEKLLFDKSGNAMILINNQLLYRDDNHLSSYGAHFVAPAFDEVFRKMSNAEPEQ